MKLKEIFQESVSSILYHQTGMFNAIKILSDGEFHLSGDFAKEAEKKTGKPMFYFSTTRSRSGGYHYDRQDNHMSNLTVLFVLDGDILNQRYKGHAVDYWGFTDELGVPLKDEMEDRIFSPHRTISTDIVESVDIYIDTDRSIFDDKWGSKLHSLFRLAENNSIPLRVFDNIQDFLVGRRPLERSEMIELFEPRKDVDFRNRRRGHIHRELKELVEVGYKMLKGHRIDMNQFDSSKSIFSRSKAEYVYDSDNVKQQINNAMFNATKEPIMEDLVFLMNRFGVKTPSDLYDDILRRLYN